MISNSGASEQSVDGVELSEREENAQPTSTVDTENIDTLDEIFRSPSDINRTGSDAVHSNDTLKTKKTCSSMFAAITSYIPMPSDVHENNTKKAKFFFIQMNCMNGALTMVVILSALLVWVLGLRTSGSWPFKDIFRNVVSDSISNGSTIHSLAVHTFDALLLMAVVIFVTLLFVLLFTYRLRFTLLMILVSFFALALAVLPFIILTKLSYQYTIPLDIASVVVTCWNMGAIGSLAVFDTTRKIWSKSFAQGILILLTVSMSWPFACLREETLWIFLGLMVIWDIVAVLTPCGPLGYVMRLHQQRIWMADPFELPEGMVYEGSYFELGLGDMLFYGVVVCRAFLIDIETGFAVSLTMLTSMSLTIFSVNQSGLRTLPALPITIAMTVAVLFWGRFCLATFAHANLYAMGFANQTIWS